MLAATGPARGRSRSAAWHLAQPAATAGSMRPTAEAVILCRVSDRSRCEIAVAGILARVTLFPGLRQYAALRQVRVPADSRRVMGWLTDPDRREREWRRLVEAEDSVQQSSVGRLPNGGLRFDQVVLQGNRLLRHTTEDVAIAGDPIDPGHRAHLEVGPTPTTISPRSGI